MANYTQLIKTINDNIKANGNQEITGPVLNAVLRAMVSALGEGYQFMGIATPDTNPGTPDGKVFYIATEPGVYSNFGVIVPNGSIGIISNTSGDWEVNLINTYYEIDVDTLMQDSPSSDDIDKAIGSLSNLRRAITVGVPFVGRSASGRGSTVAIAQVKQLSDTEVRVVMLNTGTVDGSNELVPIIKKITNSAGQLSLSTEAPTSFIGPLSSLSTKEKGSVVGAINEVNTGLKSAVKPYVVDLTDLLAAQDSESISTAIGGIDNLNGTVQKNQVIFGILANGTVAVGIRVLGNQTTLTYFVDSVVGLTVNEVIITNTSGTLTKTTNTHAVLTENMVVNNLESDEATLPLSAAQGKVLATDKQDKLKAGTGVEITSDNTVNVTLDTTVFKVVASLPESPAAGDENKIFLVPAESTEEGNIYTEYVYVNGKWEEFGTYRSEVDLTPYMKKADAEATYQKITDNALSTTAKTVVGAINENAGNVTRIDRAVGNPVIEEVDLSAPTLDNKYWLVSKVQVDLKGYAIKVLSLAKGDLLILKAYGSTSVAILGKVTPDNSKMIDVIEVGVNKVKTVGHFAEEDCTVAISFNKTSTYDAYIIKSPLNTAISGNSYMQYLHKVYEEYGAVYNKETGYWELNGLTDLTEEDMWDIYNASLTVFNSFSYDGKALVGARFNDTFRTLMDKYPSFFYDATNQYVSAFAAFQRCSNMETLCVSREGSGLQLYGSFRSMFNGCSKLRVLKYLDFSNLSTIRDGLEFYACKALKEVRIVKICTDLNFSTSPLIDYESWKYMIENAKGESAITVTVHPTTYSYLTGTAQPTAEVGGTTEEWQALVTTAQGKQISFAVPEETQSEVTE